MGSNGTYENFMGYTKSDLMDGTRLDYSPIYLKSNLEEERRIVGIYQALSPALEVS
jgi:hypothetical protein